MTIGLNPSDIPEPLELHLSDDDESTFFNNRGQTIGKVYESPTHNCKMYVSFKEEDKHLHRNRNSFAIDSDVIQTLDKQWPSVEKVAIFVIDRGKILLFDLETYIEAEEDNYGYGYQLFPEQTEASLVYEKAYNFNDDYYPEDIEVGDP